VKRTIAARFKVLSFLHFFPPSHDQCLFLVNYLPSHGHNESVIMGTSDDADAVDWTSCRCLVVQIVFDVDVEVALHDVPWSR
jgi:hypothetical protein